MAIITKDGREEYRGCVLAVYHQYDHDSDYSWEEWALRADVWDIDAQKVRTMRNIETAQADATDDVKKAIVEAFREDGNRWYNTLIDRECRKIEAGIEAVVVRGRKIPKGSRLSVFWVGDRPDFTGRDIETIAGCFDGQHHKVWIKADYLERSDIDEIKDSMEARRTQAVNDWCSQRLDDITHKDGAHQY